MPEAAHKPFWIFNFALVSSHPVLAEIRQICRGDRSWAQSHIETIFYKKICFMCTYVEILLICNVHLSRARNYATTIISKLNNFAEVLAVRVHVDVYMATPALRSLTHETLCDTGQRTADTLKFTNHHLPITKSHHFKTSPKNRWKKYTDAKSMYYREFRCTGKIEGRGTAEPS